MKFTIPNLASVLLFNGLFGSNQAQAQDRNTDPNESATVWWSDSAQWATEAHNGENDMYGLIFRNRFDGFVPCDDTNKKDACAWWDSNGQLCTPSGCHDACNSDGECGVAASFWHADIKTPQQAYPYDSNDSPPAFAGDNWNNPSVGYAAWKQWDMNGGDLKGYAYYPTDSNSMDVRDWLYGGGRPGQGCHDSPNNPNQNFQCTNDGCLTLEDNNCQCNYGDFAPWDWDYGDILTRSFCENDEGFWSCIDGDCNNGHGPDEGFCSGQPMWQAHDLSSCWVDEGDLLGMGNMDLIIQAQNSLYYWRDNYWNYEPSNAQYWGWNEVAFDKQLDDWCDIYNDPNCVPNQDALIVHLPVDMTSICDMDDDRVQMIQYQLQDYWDDGFGYLPVIFAKSIYNSNVDGYGDDGYDLSFFAQNMMFDNGACITADQDGLNEAKYYEDCPAPW